MCSPYIVTEADSIYTSAKHLKCYWVLKPSSNGVYVRASENVWRDLDMAQAESETLNLMRLVDSSDKQGSLT